MPAIRDMLDLTTLSAEAWALALSLAAIALVLIQTVRILRARLTATAPTRCAV